MNEAPTAPPAKYREELEQRAATDEVPLDYVYVALAVTHTLLCDQDNCEASNWADSTARAFFNELVDQVSELAKAGLAASKAKNASAAVHLVNLSGRNLQPRTNYVLQNVNDVVSSQDAIELLERAIHQATEHMSGGTVGPAIKFSPGLVN